MITEHTTSNGTKNHFTSFPVGYYQLHPDVSVNYQLNRYYTGDQRMLTEMRTVAPRMGYGKDSFLGQPFGPLKS